MVFVVLGGHRDVDGGSLASYVSQSFKVHLQAAKPLARAPAICLQEKFLHLNRLSINIIFPSSRIFLSSIRHRASLWTHF
jgi:hypothetical protein